MTLVPKKKPKHIVEYVKQTGGFTDQFKCSCGWLSNGYWDLPEAAWDEWLVHAFDTKTEVREVDKASQARAVKERDDHAEFRKRFVR